jgi:hypothetical protein
MSIADVFKPTHLQQPKVERRWLNRYAASAVLLKHAANLIDGRLERETAIAQLKSLIQIRIAAEEAVHGPVSELKWRSEWFFDRKYDRYLINLIVYVYSALPVDKNRDVDPYTTLEAQFTPLKFLSAIPHAWVDEPGMLARLRAA